MKIGQEFKFKDSEDIYIIVSYNRYYVQYIQDSKNRCCSIVYTMKRKNLKEFVTINETKKKFYR